MTKLNEAYEFTSRHTGIDIETLKLKNKSRKNTQARYLIAKYLRETYKMSNALIAKIMGGYHHSTIIHMCRKADKQWLEIKQNKKGIKNEGIYTDT